MTTTEVKPRATKRTVPEWLNLARVVDGETRNEIEILIEHFDMDVFGKFGLVRTCANLRALLDAYEERLKRAGLNEGTWDAINEASGFAELDERVNLTIGLLSEAWCGAGNIADDYLALLKEKYAKQLGV